MNRGLLLLTVVSALVVPSFCQEERDIHVMLNDAQYSFGRYAELSETIRCADYKRTSEDLAESCSTLKRLNAKNLRYAKAALARAVAAKNPSLIDVFDVFVQLGTIHSDLDTWSHEVPDFLGGDGIPFASAAARVNILHANLGVWIRDHMTTRCR
jgi:hypothetical protein